MGGADEPWALLGASAMPGWNSRRMPTLRLVDSLQPDQPRKSDPSPDREVFALTDTKDGMASTMKTFAFTLLLEGVDLLTIEHLDALFEAGCDDATFGQRNSTYYADFDREAPSFAEAVGSAVTAVERAVPGLRVVRVEPDDLVSAADIAVRTNRSRESVRLLIQGKRGPGRFPQPACWLGKNRPLWRWSDVADWYTNFLGDAHHPFLEATFIATLNDAFDIRRRAFSLTHVKERDFIARILLESNLHEKPR